MKDVRCGKCSRKLAVASFTEIQIKCPRCGTLNHQKATEPPPQRDMIAGTGGFNSASKTLNTLDGRQASPG